jgi:glycine cleavage system H protein
MRYFTEDHEWIDVADSESGGGETATVGITDYAQSQLGDIVFVELPASGTRVTKGGDAAVVESVKAASDIYAPVSGEVVESNAALADSPGDVNTEPMGKGWFFKIKLSNKADLDGLMDEAAYAAFVKGLG